MKDLDKFIKGLYLIDEYIIKNHTLYVEDSPLNFYNYIKLKDEIEKYTGEVILYYYTDVGLLPKIWTRII